MVRLPRNEKQTYRLNSRAQMWPSGLTLAMTLTLNFQGQIQNLLYLSQKWSDCHEMKSKHIDWTLGLKCDHRVWLWPWPWPWIFKVKYRICYISAKNGQIALKRKANMSIELQASNVTNGFELDHNLDLWILKVKCDLDLWPHRWPWPWIFMVKFWNSCISEWEGWLTLHKGGVSRSFMAMIMTIWWPRSGVWIYQVVTGVTSVVGVPSTHLVWTDVMHKRDSTRFEFKMSFGWTSYVPQQNWDSFCQWFCTHNSDWMGRSLHCNGNWRSLMKWDLSLLILSLSVMKFRYLLY